MTQLSTTLAIASEERVLYTDCTAERLLAAAKTDNEAMLEEALAELEDINGTDG